MTNILWLASYPKSGNTWLRAFLVNFLRNQKTAENINALRDFAYGDMRVEYYEQVSGRPAAELSWAEINRLRPSVHHFLAASAQGIVFVKTHNVLSSIAGVPTITPEATFGAIYVVRNPFDVALSFADHYGLTVEDGVKAICFKPLEIEPKEGHILQVISDWSTHARTWLGAEGLYLKVIRYEDMHRSPQTTFGGVLDFLKIKKDRDRMRRALRHSSFDVLSEQERRDGFVERSRNAERFFRAGKVGGWKKLLRDVQVAAIVDYHREMMIRFGYLSTEGKLLV